MDLLIHLWSVHWELLYIITNTSHQVRVVCTGLWVVSPLCTWHSPGLRCSTWTARFWLLSAKSHWSSHCVHQAKQHFLLNKSWLFYITLISSVGLVFFCKEWHVHLPSLGQAGIQSVRCFDGQSQVVIEHFTCWRRQSPFDTVYSSAFHWTGYVNSTQDGYLLYTLSRYKEFILIIYIHFFIIIILRGSFNYYIIESMHISLIINRESELVVQYC